MAAVQARPPARRPLMAGNWKMNLNHLEAIALVQKLAFTLVDADFRSTQTLVDGDRLRISYGAQDVSAQAAGAYTGEISASMLAKLGCSWVVIGHSERRQYHHEDDLLVNAKVKMAISAGLTPILCVGEPLEVRREGTHCAHALAQLDGGLADVTADQVATLVIAYEPVWAIGTGEVATPDDAQEVCAALRGRLRERYDPATADGIRILYGGSVKGSNAAGIMAQPDVDGALIGGASLDADDFVSIVRFGGEQ
jgi:triosephosphate isomerase